MSDLHYRGVRVHFEISDEHRASLSKLLRRWLFLVPHWVEDLHVSYADKQDAEIKGGIAGAGSLPQYQRAYLRLTPDFWIQDNEERTTILLHEMIHIAHGRLMNGVYERLIAPLKDRNQELADYAEADFSERLEDFTQSLTNALLTQFPFKEPAKARKR